MITFNLSGDLGEQLFQVFTLISYAIDNKLPFIFPYLLKNGEQTYWDNVFKNVRKLTTNPEFFQNYERMTNLLHQHTPYHEPQYNYSDIPPSMDNIMFYGKYQSYKYFDAHKGEIYRYLEIEYLKLQIKNRCIEYFGETTVCIDFYTGNDSEEMDFILPYQYYEDAIAQIPEDQIRFCNYMWMGDVGRNDSKHVMAMVKKLEERFKIHIPKVVYINDWERVLLASCCDCNIISNSMTGWWSAYLNDNEDKRVVCPSQWFVDERDVTDLIPESWQIVYI